MEKIRSLRAAIEAAIPDLARNPDRLVIFVNQGQIASASITSPSFEYRYEGEILLTDYSDHVDKAVVATLLWARLNEPDIFTNYHQGKLGLSFDAELIDEKKIDLVIRLPLTERVIVRELETGEVTIEHIGEPPPPDPFGPAPGNLQVVFGQYDENPVEDLTNDPVA